MIPQLLLSKALQFFIMMIFGFILVKAKVVKSEDSAVLSKLSLWLFMPAVIINAFNMDITDDVITGLGIAFLVAILIHAVFLILDFVFKKFFKSTQVERASIMYPNSGNIIVPMVAYIFGEEWVIYSSAYIIVQQVFMWTHGVGLFSGGKFSLKKILLNVNVIAILIGFVLMIFRFRLPAFAGEIVSDFGSMLAPAGMIIAGMLAAEVDFKKMLQNKRLYFVTFSRLVACPVTILILLKCIMPLFSFPDTKTVMSISFLASTAPQAATVMLLSQLYGKDSRYATAINAVTTVGCIVTMPLLVGLF